MKLAPLKNSWECCTCETQKPETSPSEDFKTKFAPPSGSCECSFGMIQNEAGNSKCAACETSKPGSSSGNDLRLKFPPPSESWECPICMIQNKAADLRCVACKTKKPGTENTGQLCHGCSQVMYKHAIYHPILVF